jgi:hypothetical protein
MSTLVAQITLIISIICGILLIAAAIAFYFISKKHKCKAFNEFMKNNTPSEDEIETFLDHTDECQECAVSFAIEEVVKS